MADEITLTVKLRYEADGDETELGVDDLSITVAGSQIVHNVQSVGTSEEALNLGEVATGGVLLAVNRDPTNFVELRAATGETDAVRLNAGEPAVMRVSADAAAPYVIADTAAVRLEYWLIEA
jgi:hypothetical protein